MGDILHRLKIIPINSGVDIYLDDFRLEGVTEYDLHSQRNGIAKLTVEILVTTSLNEPK
jgi:hypothetical protein